VHAACDLNFIVKGEGFLKVTGSHVYGKSDNISEMVLDRDVATTLVWPRGLSDSSNCNDLECL